MGAFANVLVIVMLIIAAVIGLALWLVALKQIAQSPISILRKLVWLSVVTLTLPVGLVLWYALGYGDQRRQSEIAYHRSWADRHTDEPQTELVDA